MAQDVQFGLMKAYIHMKTYTCFWQFLFVLVGFLRQGFLCVTVLPVLELAL